MYSPYATRPALSTEPAAPPPSAKSRAIFARQETANAGRRPDIVGIGGSRAAGLHKRLLAAMGFGEPMNLGASGDLLGESLWRLRRSRLDLSSAKVGFVIGGGNDIQRGRASAEAIVADYVRLCTELKARLAPGAVVVAFAVWPAVIRRKEQAALAATVNAGLADAAARGGFVYAEPTGMDPTDRRFYRADGLHNTPRGYQKFIAPALARALGLVAQGAKSAGSAAKPRRPHRDSPRAENRVRRRQARSRRLARLTRKAQRSKT